MTKLTLAQSIDALDPAKDEDWTQTGEPAMARIEHLTGNPDLKRADVRAATPDGFNRSNAHAAPTLGGQDAGDHSKTVAAPSDAGSDAGADTLGGDAGATGNEADTGLGMMEHLSGTTQAAYSLINQAFDGREFNAVTLMEAVVAAAQSDRYMRNSALQNLVRGYQVSQGQIKEVQSRLDARISDRAEKNAASRAETAARDKATNIGE